MRRNVDLVMCCVRLFLAANHFGDTGVEAVVRMAATTPALVSIKLQGACRSLFCVRIALGWMAVVFLAATAPHGVVCCVCVFVSKIGRLCHDGGRCETCSVVAAGQPTFKDSLAFR